MPWCWRRTPHGPWSQSAWRKGQTNTSPRLRLRGKLSTSMACHRPGAAGERWRRPDAPFPPVSPADFVNWPCHSPNCLTMCLIKEYQGVWPPSNSLKGFQLWNEKSLKKHLKIWQHLKMVRLEHGCFAAWGIFLRAMIPSSFQAVVPCPSHKCKCTTAQDRQASPLLLWSVLKFDHEYHYLLVSWPHLEPTLAPWISICFFYYFGIHWANWWPFPDLHIFDWLSSTLCYQWPASRSALCHLFSSTSPRKGGTAGRQCKPAHFFSPPWTPPFGQPPLDLDLSLEKAGRISILSVFHEKGCWANQKHIWMHIPAPCPHWWGGIFLLCVSTAVYDPFPKLCLLCLWSSTFQPRALWWSLQSPQRCVETCLSSEAPHLRNLWECLWSAGTLEKLALPVEVMPLPCTAWPFFCNTGNISSAHHCPYNGPCSSRCRRNRASFVSHIPYSLAASLGRRGATLAPSPGQACWTILTAQLLNCCASWTFLQPLPSASNVHSQKVLQGSARVEAQQNISRCHCAAFEIQMSLRCT